MQTLHIGTGDVGVLGKLGCGATSIQYIQGNGSGGRSVEQMLENDNTFGFFGGILEISDGVMETDITLCTKDRVFCFGVKLVVIGCEKLRGFLILTEDRRLMVSNSDFLSKNFVILIPHRKVLAWLL